LPSEEIKKALKILRPGHIPTTSPHYDAIGREERMGGWMGDAVAQERPGKMGQRDRNREVSEIRRVVTAVIQRGVEALGRSMSGDSLQGHPLGS
jgi:hypothetical protein